MFDAATKPFRSLANWFLSRGLGVVLAVIAVGFLFSILRPEVDLAKVCFSTFALLAGLAGVSFSLARSIGPDELRDRLVHVGEKFTYGALLLLASGGIAFGFAMLEGAFPELPKSGFLIARFFFVLPLLVTAFGSVGDGFTALNWILYKRRDRYKFWDNPVPPVPALGAKEPREQNAPLGTTGQPEALQLTPPQPDLASEVLRAAAERGVEAVKSAGTSRSSA